MQRQEMLAQLQETLQEASGSQSAPFTGRLSYLLNRAADRIAADYKCLYGFASTSIVANQAAYTAPTSSAETPNVSIVEIESVTLYDANGHLRMLTMETVAGMDANFAAWRVWAAQICPWYCVTLGLNNIVLSPAPNYSSAFDPTFATPGGMTFEGLCVPGHSWDAQTAECPLPTVVHEAVVDLACLYRIVQNPSSDNMARKPMIEEHYREQTDTFESIVGRFTQATRVPAYTTGSSIGAQSILGFNPLNM